MRPFVPALALLAACGAGARPAAPAAPADLAPRLEAQFVRAADAWNRGDLEAFMADYEQGDSTTFVDGRRPQRGWTWIRDHYAPLFAPGARRDSLRFEEFAVRPLSGTLALVTARFLLSREGETTASGPFTLIMEHRADGWKILHDHSSSDPRP
jgi:ketosteroid isomerase-like protein